MAMKGELVQWQEAVAAFSDKRWEQALDAFEGIADTSRIHFSIAMVYTNMNLIDDAIMALDRAVKSDPYFAAAYFQRGALRFSQDNLEEAVQNFDDALTFLRKNAFIDYTQLGLDFKLFAFQIHFNRGLCFAAASRVDSAMRDFEIALRSRPDELKNEYRAIDDAIKLGDKAGEFLNAYMVPRDRCFRPAASKVKNTQKMDFLGSSKIVAVVDSTDNYTGFSGKQLRSTLGRQARSRDPIESEPRTTLERSRSGSRTLERSRSRGELFRSESRGGSARDLQAESDFSSRGFDDDRGRKLSLFRKSSSRSLSRGRSPGRGGDGGGAGGGAQGSSSAGFFDTDPKIRRKQSEPSLSKSEYFGPLAGPLSAPIAGVSPLSLTPVASAGDKIKIKCHYNDTRLILVSPTVTYVELRARVCEKFNVEKLKLHYRDEESVLVLITDQEDMEIGFACAGGQAGHPPDRFELWCSD
ncbi:hypothetical protein BJ742DRAFT_794944 [Cladochytrium replicatum]|nr:hypothetical protein BJ742DRAFT_794944 [Cladochytrium replicatum]